MLPAKRNKIDISTLTEEEQKLFRLYGKLPTQKNILTKMQKDHRKYFDSGDYALSKAGKVSQTAVGTCHSKPREVWMRTPLIPHASTPTHQGSLSISPTNSASSVRESSLAQSESETKDDENDKELSNNEEESA
ncbi:camp-regulated phosphoprotein/endosulfine conserved region-domain-containing protein [Pisolithus albus]|nr:camp-regulated phosphoprotein/endosulfine conserved region-domain-containing protein [Pisolithus albus]